MYDKEKAEQYASIIFDRLNAFEQDALETIGRRIKEIGSLSAFDSQGLKNMADISRDMDEITKKLARITELNIEDVQRIYSQVVEESGQSFKPLYDFRNMKYIPLEENKFAQAIVTEWAKKTAETMVNLSRTKALRFVDEDVYGNVISSTPFEGAYQRIVDDAVTAVSAGTTTFDHAMRRSVEKMGGSGIRVDYGSGVTRNLSSVIRSNILYGSKMASRSYDDYIGAELGCNGYEIDAHRGCRPTHIPIQGLMCSMGEAMTVDGITYPSFHDSLEGGKSAAELMEDYGCLHIRDSVILGVSVPRYSKDELDKIYEESTELIEFDGKEKTLYEWSQAQRRIENEVRREQNVRAIAKASGQKELVKQCNDRIKTYRTVYDNLCSAVGLPNRTDRMAVFEGKRLDKSQRNGIINLGAVRMKKGGIFDYGALNPEKEEDFKRAKEHAFRFYDEVRQRKNDIESIANNTGWKSEAIQKVKDHIFINKHDLGGDEPERFYPSYDIAISWQNLTDGKNISEKDIILLKHEYLELTMMAAHGLKYKDAHRIAEKKHNYKKAVDEWRKL